jgi:hypothetical protein
MTEITDAQVESIMKEGKIKDLAEMPDDLFGVIICRIYASRMEAQGIRCYDPERPVEIKREDKPSRKVKHGKKSR